MFSKQEIHNVFNELYKQNKGTITIEQVCKALGTSQGTLRKNMLAVDGYEDCPDVFLHIKKPIHVFDTLTPQSAYWLGYIMADGCIAVKKARNSNQNDTYRLMLECKTEDREIIDKFCDYIGIRNNRITSGHKGASVALSLSTNVFTTSLESYGIVPNKSHIENHVPGQILKDETLLWQFFKGLIDGDGTIHTYIHSPGISLVSNSKVMLEELKQAFEKLLPEPSSIWILEKTKEEQKGKNATQSLFTLKIGTGRHERSNMQYIYNKFYEGQPIILTRKERSFFSLLN